MFDVWNTIYCVQKICTPIEIQYDIDSPYVIGEQRPIDPWRTCLFYQSPRNFLLHAAAIRSGTKILIMFNPNDHQACRIARSLSLHLPMVTPREILSTKSITSIHGRNPIFDDIRTCPLYQMLLKPSVCCTSKLITSRRVFLFARHRSNLSWGKVKAYEVQLTILLTEWISKRN